jgi:hypothetical protein
LLETKSARSWAMMISEALVVAANTPDAAAVHEHLYVNGNDTLFEKLELRHRLLVHEIIATLKAQEGRATCSICGEELNINTGVVDHVAEHARPLLLHPGTLLALVDGNPDLSEIFILLRTEPIRSAVDIYDRVKDAVSKGSIRSCEAMVSATQELVNPEAYCSSAASARGQPDADPRPARNALKHTFTRGGKSFSVAASRIAKSIERGDCAKYLHRATVRSNTAVRDIEDTVDEFALAHTGRGHAFESSIERSLAADGLDITGWGLDEAVRTASLRFYRSDVFFAKVKNCS